MTNKANINETLDLGNIHGNLQKIRANLSLDLHVKTEDRALILHKRATLLARELPRKITAAEYMTVIEFTLHNENYGLDIKHVGKVYPLQNFTPLPCTPNFIAGMLNIHGSIVAVVDLKTFFNLPASRLQQVNKVLILESEDTKLGILADEIVDVLSIPVSEIQTDLPTLTYVRADLMLGVTTERLVILNALNLLKDSRIVVNDLM